MAQYRVKRFRYKYGTVKSALAQNFSVPNKSEDSVKAYLEKKHRGKDIVVDEVSWA